MSALHLIQCPVNSPDFISQLKRYYASHDSILFLNDAVFSLTGLCDSKELFSISEFTGGILALKEQVEARGLHDLLDLEKVSLIDYQQFVELSIKAQKTISW